jgi:hypothetical protein
MLPTCDKTWTFSVNNVLGTMVTQPGDQKAFAYCLITQLIALGWVVDGSSNGTVAGNNDSINRILSVDNVVLAAAGVAHSWIVLRNSALAPEAAILITMQNGNAYVGIKFATTGFGLSKGGANGTTTADPTAATATSWSVCDTLCPGTGAFRVSLHIMVSSDRECTRIAVTWGALHWTQIVSYAAIEKAKNPVAEWTVPVFTWGYSYDLFDMTYASLYGRGDLIQSKVGGTTLSLYPTSDAATNISLGNWTILPCADDTSTGLPFFPIGLACTTFGHRNWRKGQIYDMWWGSVYGANTGDSYPSGPTGSLKKFMHYSNFIVPWNGLVIPDGTLLNLC